MKIAFDEHVPPGIVKVFTSLSEDEHIIKFSIVLARDYAIKEDQGDDAPWVERFGHDGGNVIISGDRRMRGRKHQRKALKDAGMIVFFFSSTWSRHNSYTKSAMLLKWWPFVERKIEDSSPGDFWEIPFQWTGTEFRNVTGP